MRICYVLLSPRFGMHQYTADLANHRVLAGDEVYLVTTRNWVKDRYSPRIHVHTPVAAASTGLELSSLDIPALGELRATLEEISADVVHLTGPHVWNGRVMRWLRKAGTPVVHTIHDLDPHEDGLYGLLVRRWNRIILGGADHILVHGRCYADALEARGVVSERITYTPLLHGCWAYGTEPTPTVDDRARQDVLFFGRFEPYKGIGDLLSAWERWQQTHTSLARLVFAGSGDLGRFWRGPLPSKTIVYDHHISDDMATELISSAALMVLPYRQATQSALVAAAYTLETPVLVTDSGALAEYVVEGETGWVVPIGDIGGLARAMDAALLGADGLRRMGVEGRAWTIAQRQQEQATMQRMYHQLLGHS